MIGLGQSELASCEDALVDGPSTNQVRLQSGLKRRSSHRVSNEVRPDQVLPQWLYPIVWKGAHPDSGITIP